MDGETTVSSLKDDVRVFAEKRGWTDENVKNLAGSVVIEATELYEIFQWSDTADARECAGENVKHVAEEVADVAVYLLRFCQTLGIDLSEAVREKLAKNAERYPEL